MSDKGKGVLSYLFGVLGGVIVLYAFKDNNKKTCVHAAQAIVISGGVIAVNVVLSMLSVITGFDIPFVSFILYILEIALIIMGIVKVLNDEKDPKLPVVGDIAEKLFEKTIAAAPEVVVAGVQPKFDPNTGEPIQTTPVVAKFDPNTGEPIGEQPKPKFDPNTGEKIEEVHEEEKVEEAPVEEVHEEEKTEETPVEEVHEEEKIEEASVEEIHEEEKTEE